MVHLNKFETLQTKQSEVISIYAMQHINLFFFGPESEIRHCLAS